MATGGAIANYTGKILEKFIKDRLIEKGYTFVDKSKFKPACYLGQPIYTKQYLISQSIYGTDLFCDFIIFHPQKYPNCLIIESKWQQSGGSVDEKYPYMVENIRQVYPCEVVILLDGKGYKGGAAAWLKRQIGGKLKDVFDMAQFSKWANQGGI